MVALFILVLQYQQASKSKQKHPEIYNFFLKNLQFINNWDLVDCSCHKIVGAYLIDKKRDILEQLATAKFMWKRRIAIIRTLAFLKQKDYIDTMELA